MPSALAMNHPSDAGNVNSEIVDWWQQAQRSLAPCDARTVQWRAHPDALTWRVRAWPSACYFVAVAQGLTPISGVTSTMGGTIESFVTW